MRPHRLGRCILPLASKPSYCQRISGFSLATRSYASHGTVQSGDPIDAVVKRKRGRPRKIQDPEPLKSSTAAIGNVASQPTASEPIAPTDIPSQPSSALQEHVEVFDPRQRLAPTVLETLPSPSPQAALSSAKLSALHARLSLPQRLPLQSLARSLVHSTADPDARFNNSSLAELGADLLGQHIAEQLIAKHPRLPMAVLYAASNAFIGRTACSKIVEGWGVEAAGEPGGEVDPGLLQFKRALPGSPTNEIVASTRRDTNRRGDKVQWRRGMSSRVVFDDMFGELQNEPGQEATPGITDIETASTSFFRALIGSLYLHAGAEATYKFFQNHVLSRHLDISRLFTFQYPLRDLNRLCAREGFESPVARLISETGRLTRAPVFVVGIFSGQDELGQGVGSSLNEARFKAAISALKAWYLYSPAEEAVVPSQASMLASRGKAWKPLMVDCGEMVS